MSDFSDVLKKQSKAVLPTDEEADVLFRVTNENEVDDVIGKIV